MNALLSSLPDYSPNTSIYQLEVAELRRERDEARVALASATLDVARLLAERKRLSAGLRRLLGESRGDISPHSKRRAAR